MCAPLSIMCQRLVTGSAVTIKGEKQLEIGSGSFSYKSIYGPIYDSQNGNFITYNINLLWPTLHNKNLIGYPGGITNE